jgi:hypothetical protein
MLTVPHEGTVLLNNKKIRFLMPRFYDNISYLDLSHNSIRWLPYMPNVKVLKAANCKLTTLIYSENLEELEVQNNNLTAMPAYPKLRRLNCSNNALTQLPPASSMPALTHLICSNNPLSNVQGDSLREVEAYNCLINTIHHCPNLLRRSSVMIGGRSTGLQRYAMATEYNNVLINWNTQQCSAVVVAKLGTTCIWRDVLKLLFYSAN